MLKAFSPPWELDLYLCLQINFQEYRKYVKHDFLGIIITILKLNI